MSGSVFVIGDGNNIRKNVELYLLSGDFERLKDFSSALTEAIHEIARLAVQNMDAKIVFAGGDDIFFITTLANFQEEKMHTLMEVFARETGCSISFGAGQSVDEAFLNLRRAKASLSENFITFNVS